MLYHGVRLAANRFAFPVFLLAMVRAVSRVHHHVSRSKYVIRITITVEPFKLGRVMLGQRNERSTDNNHFRWGASPGSFWTRDAFEENRFYGSSFIRCRNPVAVTGDPACPIARFTFHPSH